MADTARINLFFGPLKPKAQSSMKYPRQFSMPSGIQLWLEEQLTLRGVDATVYSKYILGVLCNESSDLSAQPKDSGVRTLIDELRVKLKGFQEKGQYPFSDFPPSKKLEVLPSQLPPDNKASRHTSSFSSSTKKSKADSISSSLGSSGVWSGKRSFGSSVGKNRTVSEGNNRDTKFNGKNYNCLEEDKENNGGNRDVREKMRSRSTVKQTPEKTSRNMAKSLDRKDDLNRKAEASKRRLYHQPSELPTEHTQNIWASEKSFDDLTGCDQDLPMDFQQLLESPQSSKVSPDFSRCIGTKQPSSFIQCGTNITSSIWSEKAEDVMDCSLTGEISSDMGVTWGPPTEAAINRAKMMQESAQYRPDLWNSGDSWKVVGNVPLAEFPKWSDIESTSLLLNNPSNFFSNIGLNIHGSLTTLNHNKEDSSFTEVIPKASMGFNTNKDKMVFEQTVQRSENDPNKKEEDLLTSMKTHFRPIKQETVEVVAANTGPTFPDGTTFPISNSLDEPNFHRSPGGSLYLDSDMNNKYMEFNDADDDTPSEFVPKYRVRQNEKFCQTDEVVLPPQSDCEQLYFPEDEQLVRSMVEEDEEEEDQTFWGAEACIKVDGWMATWPATGIWSNEPNVQQIWCGGNVWTGGAGAGAVAEPEPERSVAVGDQYTRLRNEWSQEAEELFSDISQHLCLGNYADSQPAKLVDVEIKAKETPNTVRGVSRERKRRHWSSQLGGSCPPPSLGPARSRPLTL